MGKGEEIQMFNLKEIKTTKYQFSSTKLAQINNTDNIQCWWQGEEMETLKHYCWKYKCYIIFWESNLIVSMKMY